MSLENAKQEAMAQVEAQSAFQFEMAMRKVNLVGQLTNWRKMKSPHRAEKILAGRARILALIRV